MMQIFFGQAPPQVWWGILILLLAVAVSTVLRAYTKLVEARAHKEVALAALRGGQSLSADSAPPRVIETAK